MYRLCLNSVFATACGTCWGILFLLTSSPALAQYQATSISYLTTLPARDDGRGASNTQDPKQPPPIVAEGLAIVPPFAWNRTDTYVPPDFNNFFPDDPEGGKQLDALFSRKLGGGHTPSDIFAAVRRGLRHTRIYKNQILAQVGNGFVWGVKEQDPAAIELLYHASDPKGPVAHDGMYYGLTVLNQRSPSVMRALLENYTHYDREIQNRIPWGFQTYGDKQQTGALLRQSLNSPEQLSEDAIVAGLDLYRTLTGTPFEHHEALADRGRFVIGFTIGTSQEATTPNATTLEGQLKQWLKNDRSIIALVTRVVEDRPVGVALVQGIGVRTTLAETIGQDPNAKLLFVETFAPVVLQKRQLREFANYLPEGLPASARPPYAANPQGERFSWNALDGYQPPNFERYFPDDPAAGTRLDQLFAQRTTTELPARQQLEIIRAGLRHTKSRQGELMAWTSTIAGWPSDPMEKEIFYHAADPRADPAIRQCAIYFGLRGWWQKPPNVLRLFAEILLNEPTDHYLSKETVGSIQWSLRDKTEQQTVATYLDEALKEHERYSPAVLMRLSNIVTDWLGHKPTNYAAFKERGNFFLLFRHRDHPQLSSLTSFTNKSFANEAYWVETIGVEAEQEVSMFLVIRGLEGLERALAKLSAIEGVMIDFGGPMSELKSAEKLPPQLQKYISP